MTPESLIESCPRLFHMTMDGAWPTIERLGLLSTSSLLTLFEVPEPTRAVIEAAIRPACVALEHPVHGRAVIRDNKPMSESGLRRCLRDMTPTAWMRVLNERVFLWPTERRLCELLNAQAYRDTAHCVITICTAGLLAGYQDRVTLSPINSGSTLYKPMARGPQTFRSVADYPFEEWSAKRGRKKAIAEVAVSGGIDRIKEVAIRAERRKRDQVLEVIWQAPLRRSVEILPNLPQPGRAKPGVMAEREEHQVGKADQCEHGQSRSDD